MGKKASFTLSWPMIIGLIFAYNFLFDDDENKKEVGVIDSTEVTIQEQHEQSDLEKKANELIDKANKKTEELVEVANEKIEQLNEKLSSKKEEPEKSTEETKNKTEMKKLDETKPDEDMDGFKKL